MSGEICRAISPITGAECQEIRGHRDSHYAAQRFDIWDRTDAPITWAAAVAVLWEFDTKRGFRPGGFEQALVTAIARGDADNQALFALGFPEYVTAVQCALYRHNGIRRLRAIANSAGPTPFTDLDAEEAT